jgi:hypothetical protein
MKSNLINKIGNKVVSDDGETQRAGVEARPYGCIHTPSGKDIRTGMEPRCGRAWKPAPTTEKEFY